MAPIYISGEMRRKKQKKLTVFLLLMVVFAVFLTGCRESPVLESLVYTQDNPIDYDVQSYDREEEEEMETDSGVQENREEDSGFEEYEQEAAVESSDGTADSDVTFHLTYDEDSGEPNGKSNDLTTGEDTSDTSGVGQIGNTTGATGAAPNEEGGSNTREGGEQEPEEEDTGNYDEDEDTGDDGDSQGPDEGINVEPSNEKPYKQVVDNRGQTVDVPENVDKVVATGEVATIVEMLGGAGRLIASSSSFTSGSWANKVFGSAEISNVATWWNGTGNATISDENFNALLAAAPDVCFEVSGSGTFTNAQIGAMEEKGIAYVVLPELTKIENITQAVQLVGEVLGDRTADGMTDAPRIAQTYSSFVDNLLRNASGPGSMKLTVYIGGWDASKYVTYMGNEEFSDQVYLEGYGAALMKYGSVNTTSNSPYGGFSEWSFWHANEGKSYYDSTYLSGAVDYALYYSGVINNGSSLREEGFSWNGYVFPLAAAYIDGVEQNRSSTGVSYYLLSHYNMNSMQNEINLGQSAFPAVIVADSSIKEAIEKDRAWNSYINQDAYTAENTKIYTLFKNGIEYHSLIAGDYDIYVNPSGVGSWADGSAESILETAWGTYKFWGDKYVTKSQLQDYVQKFYSTFYHYDLSASELAEILGE